LPCIELQNIALPTGNVELPLPLCNDYLHITLAVDALLRLRKYAVLS